jgi:hypothetical protein
MTTATLTLSGFLLERIGEDAAVAWTATPGPWRWAEGELEAPEVQLRHPHMPGHTYSATVLSATYDDSGVDGTDIDKAHIARWDPARVLAECEAKQRVAGLHRAEAGHFLSPARCAECSCDIGDEVRSVPFPCTTLRLLALPYAGHEQYREEWRPLT